jgi:hypothetical protein
LIPHFNYVAFRISDPLRTAPAHSPTLVSTAHFNSGGRTTFLPRESGNLTGHCALTAYISPTAPSHQHTSTTSLPRMQPSQRPAPEIVRPRSQISYQGKSQRLSSKQAAANSRGTYARTVLSRFSRGSILMKAITYLALFGQPLATSGAAHNPSLRIWPPSGSLGRCPPTSRLILILPMALRIPCSLLIPSVCILTNPSSAQAELFDLPDAASDPLRFGRRTPRNSDHRLQGTSITLAYRTPPPPSQIPPARKGGRNIKY